MDLQIFKNENFGQVRVIQKGDQPWFAAKDVCEVLEIKNTTDALKRLDADEVTRFNLGGLSGETNFVNEYGLYSLVLGSRKVEAKQFKRWITHEVIPAIRKHGGYLTQQKVEEALLNPDTLIQLATQLKDERAKRIQSEKFINRIATSENSILVRELAKVASKDGFVIGERRLWDKLREWGMIFKRSTEPMQEYIDRGYFEVVEGAKESSSGAFTYRTTKVTGKGQVYIINRLLKEAGDYETA